MGETMYCLTWIQDLLKQRFHESDHEPYYRLGNGTSISSLPDDIVINILSRLDAKSVLACKLVCSPWHRLCSTSYFSEIHHTRATTDATPMFLGQNRSYNDGSKETTYMFLLEECGKYTRLKKVCIKLEGFPKTYELEYKLYDSCNGFVLFFTPPHYHLVQYIPQYYVIYNPVTRENASFCEKGLHLFGFFYHQLDKDYKILFFGVDETNMTCQYYTYGFCTKAKKKIGSSPYSPMRFNGPAVSVYGALFWMVCDTNDRYPRTCTKCIMTFNLTKESFHVMPHPGASCTYGGRWSTWQMHEQMRLLEMDELLSFTNLCEKMVEVWVLEDLANWVWIKRYVVNLDQPYNSDARFRCLDHPVVAIQSGKLLLHWPSRGLFWCDLRSNLLHKMARESSIDIRCCVLHATRYTGSFVSLDRLNK